MDAHLKQGIGILVLLIVAALVSWQLTPATSAPIIPKVQIVTILGDELSTETDALDNRGGIEAMWMYARLFGFDGTNWDRLRVDRNVNLATDEQAAEWSVTGDSAANTAQTITKAAVSGQSHYITMACAGARAATVTAADVSLQENTTQVSQFILPANGSTFCPAFTRPYKLGAGLAANLVIPAGGTSVITIGTLQGYTK